MIQFNNVAAIYGCKTIKEALLEVLEHLERHGEKDVTHVAVSRIGLEIKIVPEDQSDKVSGLICRQ